VKIPLRYAENLSLSATEDYTIARLRNPWDTTRILHIGSTDIKISIFRIDTQHIKDTSLEFFWHL